MATKVIQLSLPEELLRKLDIAANEEFANRSEFISQSVIERLKYVDECRASLVAAALNTVVPTEDELLRLLRIKVGSRQWKRWRRQ